MTKKEAMEELGISQSTLQRYIQQKVLKPTYRAGKWGKQAVFSKADVEALKKARELLKGKP